jgi:hypothetical protein
VKTTNKFQNISVKGFITIKDQYTLPISDGAYGDIMITDGIGGVTFQTPSALALTTATVTEDPSNLYFTDERVDDRVDQLIIDGTGLSWTYLDGVGTLQGNVSLLPFTTTDLAEGTNQYYTGELVDDRVSTLLQNGTGISWVYSDNGTSAGTLTPTISISSFDTDDLAEGAINKYLTNENIDDRVSDLILDGTGLTWTYNDPANTLTGNISLTPFNTDDLLEGALNKYYLDENVADYLGNTLIQDSATITWLYNDLANTLTATAASSPIEIQKAGALVGTRGILNFIEGTDTSISVVDNGANSRIDVTVTNTSPGNPGTLNTILANNIQIGDSDIELLNFSDKFVLAEPIDKNITIDIVMLIEELSNVVVSSPIVNGDVLQYNSGLGLWENVSLEELHDLDSLSDVTLTSPIINGEILRYNSGSGEWENSTNSLYLLNEVETSMSPIEGDVMRFNAISSKWEAGKPLTIISKDGTQVGNKYPHNINFSNKFSVIQNGVNPDRIDVGVDLSINDLSDIIISTPLNGEIIKYNSGSGQWENAADGSSVILQDAYDNSTLGRITTDITRGSFEIKQGSGSNTDIILEGINDVDATVFSLTGEGKISAGEWNGTELGILYGGTGQTTAQAAIDALTQVSSGTTSHVLTKDGSGNATWQATAAADLTIIQVDGVQVSTGSPTLDFDSTYFSLTESPTDDFDITFLPGGIDHDSLLNFVTDEHIDHTNVTITAGSGLSYSVFGTDISQDSTIELDINSLTTESVIAGTDFIAFWDVPGVTNKKITVNNFLTGLSLGLTQVLSADNTTSGRDIIMTAGDNIVFEHGSFGSTIGTETLTADWGVNLPNASGILALTSQTNGTIGHDTDLTGVVSDEHIDHTQVTLTAGIGLTGGGTIAANRTFDLDIPGLTDLTDAGVLASGDTFAVYNLSATAHEEVTLTQLATGIQTELGLVDGSGATNEVAYWADSDTLTGDSNYYFNSGTQTLVVPNLTVNGTTTTVNSTTVTIDDPVFTIGGDTSPVADDNKDRGIEFRWFSGSEKSGFFGFDDSTGRFTFIPDSVNTGEVFSGTVGDVEFGGIYGTIQTVSQTNITEIGTITTGTWNGTAIGDTYISSAATWNALVSNVTTNLSEGTSTTTTVDVDSSDGTNATLAAASTIRAGVMTKAKFDEVVANNAKISNVSTDLSLGPISATTMDINSSDGTNVTLTEADTTNAGLLGSDKWDEIVANTTYSGVGHLPLSGGTMTGDIVMDSVGGDKNIWSNNATLANRYQIVFEDGVTDSIRIKRQNGADSEIYIGTQLVLGVGDLTTTNDGTNITVNSGTPGAKFIFLDDIRPVITDTGSIYGTTLTTELLTGSNTISFPDATGTVMLVGAAPTAHTHLLADGATDVTATAAEVNLLDLAALTARDVLVASGATAASWRPLVEADISDLGSYVDGTGAANTVAYWTDANTLSNDNDFNFDGVRVAINHAINAEATLRVLGQANDDNAIIGIQGSDIAQLNTGVKGIHNAGGTVGISIGIIGTVRTDLSSIAAMTGLAAGDHVGVAGNTSSSDGSTIVGVYGQVDASSTATGDAYNFYGSNLTDAAGATAYGIGLKYSASASPTQNLGEIITAQSGFYADTEFVMIDSSGVFNFSNINDLTADASPVGSTDYIMTWDADTSLHKKVLLDDLPGGGATTLTGDVTGSGTGSFATTIATGAVDIAMLANGTDGELITWDATGVATTVAAGTSNQVLTSNGAGAAPTFQSQGSSGWTRVTETSATRTAAADEFILINNASCIITLPSPVDNVKIAFKTIIAPVDIQIKTNTAGVDIDGTDYSSTGLILSTAYEQISLISDGTDWYIY